MAMEFRKKIHPSVLYKNVHESAKDKQQLNVQLVHELDSTLQDISTRKHYLHEYWYNLKYYVKSLHAAYRLLYKTLHVYGDSNLCKKFMYHDLIDGPRPIQQNLELFSELIKFVSLQLAYIQSIVLFKLNICMQNQITLNLHRLVKFFYTVIWLRDVTEKYMRNGLPIRMEFI